MKRFLYLAAFLQAVALSANPVSTTPSTYGTSAVTSTVTYINYDPTAPTVNGTLGGWQVHVEASFSGTEPVNCTGNVVVYAASGPYLINDASMSRDGVRSLSITSTLRVAANVPISHGVYVGAGGAFYVNTESLTTPMVTYKISFAIPANTTDKLIRYEVWQDGVYTGKSVTTAPGDPASIASFTGLTSADPCTLNEVSPQLEVDTYFTNLMNNGQTYYHYGQGNIVNVVNGGSTPQLSGSTGGSPAPVAPAHNLPSSPGGTPPAPTPPITAPTSTTPLAAHSLGTPLVVPTPPVAPTPTGDTAATKADLMTSTNAIVAAVGSHTAQTVTNTNAVTAAVDKVGASVVNVGNSITSSTDKTTAAINASLNQSLVASDKVATAVAVASGQNLAQLVTVNNKLTQLNGTAGQIQTNTAKVADDTAAMLVEQKKITAPSNITNGQFDSAGGISSARSAAGAAGSYSGPAPDTGNAVTTTFTSSPSGSPIPTQTLHVGSVDVTIGALPGWSDNAMSILHAARPLLLIALCVWFIRSSSDTVERYVIGLGNAGSGGSALVGVENVVPGVTQAKHLASATAIVVVGLAACAAVVALVDTVGNRYGVGLSALFNAFDLSSLGSAVGWIDGFVPVAASSALVILRAGVGYLAAPIYLTAASLSRFLHV